MAARRHAKFLLSIGACVVLICGCGTGEPDVAVTIGVTGAGGDGDAGGIGAGGSDSTSSDGTASSGGSSGGSSTSSGGSSTSSGSSGGSSTSSGGSSTSSGSSGGSSTSSGGSSTSSGSSGGSSTSSGSSSSSGGASTSSSSSSSSGGSSSGGGSQWPAGPEDNIKGVPESQAKYTECSKLWACTVSACQIDPKKGCMNVCMNAASEALIPAIMDFTKCYHHICHDKMCKTGDKKCLSDCMWSRCSGFGMKCNVIKKTGPKTCETAFTCFESCKGPTTIQCLANCYTTLSKAAQSDYTKLWFCLAKSDAPQPFSDCLATALNCASGGTTGTKSCLDVSTCDSACKPDNDGEKFSCTAKCYGGGTSAAQGQFNALMKCVLEAQTAGADPGKLCGKSVAVCAGSKPDGTKGTLGCQEISGCEQVCKKANGEDAGCTMTCLGKSTVSEAMKWWELAMCWGKCSEKCKGGSATCVQDCVSKDCKAQSLACLGG